MWRKSENSEAVLPAEIERTGNAVIVRRKVKHIEETDERAEHYEYEEMQMSPDQYELYADMMRIADEQADALVELASIISEVM